MSSGDPRRPVATGSQTVGPFFHFGLTNDAALGSIAPGPAGGERIRLRIRVLDGEGALVPDALIELYHADAAGAYAQPSYSGFGRLPTGEDGACTFETVRPGPVPDGRGGLQAAHINVCLFARGLLRHLYTRVYFEADPLLATDPLLALVPAERRHTLLARHAGDGIHELVVRLQGADETVFFDL